MTLNVRGLHVTRQDRKILDNVTAAFQPGQMTVILGPNGAGKSTLLKCLAGLLKPDSGAVMLNGQDLSTLPARQRAKAIGLLPQSAETHWAIHAEALVALGHYPHRRGWGMTAADRAAIDAAMAATDTACFAGRPVTDLSGGERARVLMARVLAGEPQWILADEPLANLDPGHQIDMLSMLRTQADAGRAVVAVLHDLASAARFSNQLILLHNGSVFAAGPASEVLTPANLYSVYGIEARVDMGEDKKVTIQILGRSPRP